MGGAVAGNLPHHVRVDRRHRHIDHLELHVRVAVAQQDFEDPADTERWLRNALRRGTSENEDANGPGGFGREKARFRETSKRTGEEPPSKPRVARVRSVGIGTDKESRRITVAAETQPGLQQTEEQQRRETS